MANTTRTRVLITVMTYPNVSQKYREIVCTAGITQNRDWVRLYPIDYRYLPPEKRFRKYQWIEVDLFAKGQGGDDRLESRKPNLDSINVLGEPLGTKDGWADRRASIDAMPHHTVNQLKQLHDQEKRSLGIVRPVEVLDLEIREADKDWSAEKLAIINQLDLFADAPKNPLQKLPFSFHYKFKCSDSGNAVHTAMCEDWELGVLFLKEVERLGSEAKAAESVKKKFLDELCRADKDTRFFMGTYFPYNTWLILGVFWPPKTYQPRML